VSWAIQEKGYTQRRACRLVGLESKTYRYASTPRMTALCGSG
jgi:putative transposase